MILLIAGAIFAYVKLHDKFDGKQHDPRGFARSKSGIYGTASWMDEKEMKEVLEISPVPDAKGTILGEYNGKAVCMPEDTRLNRHIAIFGASGTMKSRAIIRNALFQTLRRSESVIVTDSKGELYADTSEMFRNAGYDVKIYMIAQLIRKECQCGALVVVACHDADFVQSVSDVVIQIQAGRVTSVIGK